MNDLNQFKLILNNQPKIYEICLEVLRKGQLTQFSVGYDCGQTHWVLNYLIKNQQLVFK